MECYATDTGAGDGDGDGDGTGLDWYRGSGDGDISRNASQLQRQQKPRYFLTGPASSPRLLPPYAPPALHPPKNLPTSAPPPPSPKALVVQCLVSSPVSRNVPPHNTPTPRRRPPAADHPQLQRRAARARGVQKLGWLAGRLALRLIGPMASGISYLFGGCRPCRGGWARGSDVRRLSEAAHASLAARCGGCRWRRGGDWTDATAACAIRCTQSARPDRRYTPGNVSCFG
ncbi:hypothetical protein EDC01DRAFT_162262 [Geopyxis carbonaria]|nr:hypothetical protein EDC01DRAFT_162262 [Geopyxis carbonaria]